MSAGLYGCHRPVDDDDDRPCGYELRTQDALCFGCFRSGQVDRAEELADALLDVQKSWAKRWGVADDPE